MTDDECARMLDMNNMYMSNMEVAVKTTGKELKTEKFQMLMDKSTLTAVDDWGFANRVRTRAEAIRKLIRMGLSADDHETKEGPVSA